MMHVTIEFDCLYSFVSMGLTVKFRIVLLFLSPVIHHSQIVGTIISASLSVCLFEGTKSPPHLHPIKPSCSDLWHHRCNVVPRGRWLIHWTFRTLSRLNKFVNLKDIPIASLNQLFPHTNLYTTERSDRLHNNLNLFCLISWIQYTNAKHMMYHCLSHFGIKNEERGNE